MAERYRPMMHIPPTSNNKIPERTEAASLDPNRPRCRSGHPGCMGFASVNPATQDMKPDCRNCHQVERQRRIHNSQPLVPPPPALSGSVLEHCLPLAAAAWAGAASTSPVCADCRTNDCAFHAQRNCYFDYCLACHQRHKEARGLPRCPVPNCQKLCDRKKTGSGFYHVCFACHQAGRGVWDRYDYSKKPKSAEQQASPESHNGTHSPSQHNNDNNDNNNNNNSSSNSNSSNNSNSNNYNNNSNNDNNYYYNNNNSNNHDALEEGDPDYEPAHDAVSPQVLTVLLVGEVGAGKSTLVNAVANLCLGGSLHNLQVAVPCRHHPVAIACGASVVGSTAAEAAATTTSTSSQTTVCTKYSFQKHGTVFDVIDTPGLSASDAPAGLHDNDNSPDQHAVCETARQLPHLSAVVLVVNGTTRRIADRTKRVVQEVRARGSGSALPLFVVCTNCREFTCNFDTDSLRDLRPAHFYYTNTSAFSSNPKIWDADAVQHLQKEWDATSRTVDTLLHTVVALAAPASAHDKLTEALQRLDDLSRELDGIGRLSVGGDAAAAAAVARAKALCKQARTLVAEAYDSE